MIEVDIEIGGRSFTVACEAGEESHLRAAAALLDSEAQSLSTHLGRIPDSRMLLMAGLLLADKTKDLESRLSLAEQRLGQTNADLERLQSAPPKVEVPVVPPQLSETLKDAAEQAESIVKALEDKLLSQG